jgi:hypothetical protein
MIKKFFVGVPGCCGRYYSRRQVEELVIDWVDAMIGLEIDSLCYEIMRITAT